MVDSAGAFTRATGRALEDDSGKPRYLQYQRGLIEPHCGPTVLEVGAGTGEFASGLRGPQRLVLTDVDPVAVRYMKERFAWRADVDVRGLDLDASNVDLPRVDSVVAVNVLEHIEDDAGALRRMAGLVRPGGTIVLWVPAYQQLYGEFDRLVGHVRRYTPRTVSAAAHRAGLTVREVRPVNFLGAFAWWLAVRRGGSQAPNRKLVRIYDRWVVPVTAMLERLVRVPFGQSVLCVLEVD